MSRRTLPWLEEQSPRDLIRWAAAALIVICVHAAAAGYFFLRQDVEDVGGDADVVTVELAPIDSTPDAVAHDFAPAPETMIESNAVPQPQERKEIDEMKLEQPPEADATVPLPNEKPPEKTEQARPPAPRTAEQVKGGAPRIEPSWQSTLVRHLQRYKRYPAQAQSRGEEGVVVLSFSVDRTGHVLAHRVMRGSGHADLDEEVMAMIMRAEPLPPFPESMPETRIDLTVPIRFSLH